jgi:hypothetical protein
VQEENDDVDVNDPAGDERLEEDKSWERLLVDRLNPPLQALDDDGLEGESFIAEEQAEDI